MWLGDFDVNFDANSNNNDTGRPAPWPDDILDPEAGWTTGTIDVPAVDGDENDPESQPF